MSKPDNRKTLESQLEGWLEMSPRQRAQHLEKTRLESQQQEFTRIENCGYCGKKLGNDVYATILAPELIFCSAHHVDQYTFHNIPNPDVRAGEAEQTQNLEYLTELDSQRFESLVRPPDPEFDKFIRQFRSLSTHKQQIIRELVFQMVYGG